MNLVIHMFSKTIYVLLMAFVTGCSGMHTGNQDSVLQTYAPGIVIVSEPVGKGYYALLDNQSGHWRVLGDLSKKRLTRQSDSQEVLFINHRFRSIAPVFDKGLNTHGANCTPYIHNKLWYWVCTSQFSSVEIAETIGINIVSCALTLCLGAGSRVELDHDKVAEAVIQSNLIQLAETKISNEKKGEYLSDFSRAMKSRDVDELEFFISKYRGQDPDNLIPEAIDRIDSIRAYAAFYSDLNRILDEAK